LGIASAAIEGKYH